MGWVGTLRRPGPRVGFSLGVEGSATSFFLYYLLELIPHVAGLQNLKLAATASVADSYAIPAEPVHTFSAHLRSHSVFTPFVHQILDPFTQVFTNLFTILSTCSHFTVPRSPARFTVHCQLGNQKGINPWRRGESTCTREAAGRRRESSRGEQLQSGGRQQREQREHRGSRGSTAEGVEGEQSALAEGSRGSRGSSCRGRISRSCSEGGESCRGISCRGSSRGSTKGAHSSQLQSREGAAADVQRCRGAQLQREQRIAGSCQEPCNYER